MKKINFLYVFFLLFSIVWLRAQPQIPILFFPEDYAQNVPIAGTELQWFQLDYEPPFHMIDVHLDNVEFPPGPIVYSGLGMELFNGMLFAFPTEILIPNQTYFWSVRITDLRTMLSAESPVHRFTTQDNDPPLPPPPPLLIYPEENAMNMPVEDLSLVWEQQGWHVDSFFDVYCDIDPDFPNPPVFSGPLTPSGVVFEYLIEDLLVDTSYYWLIRYHDLLQEVTVESIYRQFRTGNYTVLRSTISGKTLNPTGGFVSGIKVTCPGACVPASVYSSGIDGSYSFSVNNSSSVSYTVTPIPALVYKYFSPTFRSYSNISSDQLNQDYYYNSYKANLADVISPSEYAEGVSVNIGQLTWSYVQLPGYGTPNQFDVYFPADAAVPFAMVAYEGRDPEYSVDIVPLEYNTEYTWKVVPTNEYGEAEDVETWFFTTEDPPLPPLPPLLIYPEENAMNMPVEDLSLLWEQQGWQVDSFFDVYCDIDPDFPNPPVWSGSLDPQRVLFEYNLASLIQDQVYYWYVKYTNLAEGWYQNSLIRQFTTGNYAIPYSTISGTISSVHNVSAVKVSCPQACVPASVNTGIAGTYSFTVNNGLNPVVTPVKQGYFFSPGFAQFNNIQTNQTANFGMSSIYPNAAIQPVPANLASDVSIDIGQLQWTYIQEPGYSPPLGFEIYFPADSPLPYAVVLYTGRDPLYTVDIYSLEYSSPYEWRVQPFNDDGWAEYMETWSFSTEDPPAPDFPPTPLYVYPPDNFSDTPESGLYMVWGPMEDREEFPVESFFDVFVDIDPALSGPPIYSGPAIIYPHDPAHRYIYGPQLELATIYFWKVVVTDMSNGLSTASDVWEFMTSPLPVERPEPLLLAPPEGSVLNPGEGVDLIWEHSPWHVDSFFDVFCDIDPAFPNPPVCTLAAEELVSIYQFHLEGLLPGQTYYWFVRYSNPLDYWYSFSQFGSFIIAEDSPAPPPLLISPPDLAQNVPIDTVELSWTCDPDWWVESFFDVFCDIDPTFPDPPVYSGTGADLLDGEVYILSLAPLLHEQTYHWYVRVTNLPDGESAQSGIWCFTTELNVLTAPELSIAMDGTLYWDPVAGADSYIIYRSICPDGEFYPVWNTVDNFWLDPAFPDIRGFYKVTAVSGRETKK